ncbi:YadA-like family protein [Achromobacter insolitus]|uniref:YadA-like family protein n=2 Tax=Achromobacter insolitus TaxID=217204 RepID=UPI001EF7A7A5|nr:YadA-like family protein [Achromobacter insolitus]
MQAVASGASTTALGQWTRATGTGAVAIGGNNSSNTAASGAQASGSNAVAIAGQSRATGGEAIAIGVRSSAVNNGDVAIGADSVANGTTNNLAAVAVGRGSRAVGEDAVALGNSARAEAHYGAAIGNFAAVTASNATAIGNSSNASGVAATSIGNFSAASGRNAVAIGGGGVPGSYVGARASGGGAVALGGNQVRGASSAAQDGIALGGESTVDANAASGIAVGRGARVYDNAAYGVALGDGAAARGEHDIVIGRDAATSAQSAGNNIAMGNAVTTGAEGQNVAIGSGSTSAVASDASGGAVAIGRDQKATGNGAVALGDPNTANGDGAVALGQNNVAAGDAAGNSVAQGAVAIGSGNQAIGQGSVALGNASQTAAAGSIALGDSASTEALNGVALGSNAVAANAGDVALGSGSTTAAAVGTSQTVINGTTYSFAGTTPSSTVSVGAAGEERTITNVAAGRLSETSTDAINGSQLYATNQAVGTLGTNVNNLGNSTAAAIGAGSSYDPATGQVAPPSFNIAGGNQTNIGDAINALNQGWTLTTAGNATGTSATAIQPGSTMTVTGGNNIQLTQNGSEITVATSATPTFDSVSINGGPMLSGTGIDMGNRKITNVAAGTDPGDAVNVSQLDNARTRYYSVNDGGLVQGNYNNDGAVGWNSIAAGVGAMAQSTNGVAMGYNARSIGPGGMAIGEYSEAHGESDVYVGGAAGANGQAGNYRNTGVGERAGSNVAGADNTAIGGTTGNNVTGTANFAGGAYSGSNVTGNANIAIGGVGSQCGGSSGSLFVAGGALMDCDPAEISAGVNVTGSNNIAMGPAAGSNLTGDNNIALGNQAGAGISANNTFAAGTQAAARSDNDIAIGSAAATAAGTGGNNIAIGNGVTTGADGQNVAIGSGSTSANASDASGGAVAIGRDQTAIGNGAVALGDPNTANGDGAVALGQNNIAAGDAAGNSAAQGAVAIGSGNQAIGQGSVALGNASQTAAAGSLALGDTARTAALNGVALGSNAIASNAGDVALGAGSATAAAVGTSQVVINGTTYSFAGTAPSSTVSVGAAGEERTITNVAAGRISGTSTDAINGSQLYATNQAVEQAGDTITNIAGDTSQANTDANGMGIRYVRTNEAGLTQSDASAQGQGSTAVGYDATATAESALALGREANASHAGSVALGANAVADGATLGTAAYNPGTATIAGTTPVGEVSVGSANAERRLTNVAAGATDTDAVNVSQLKSVAASVSDLDAGTVKYDRNPDGTVNYESVTLNPGGAPTTIGNVAAGELSATSTEAVNGSQLNETNQNVAQMGDTITNIAGDTSQANTDANGMGIRYVRTNEAGLTQSDASAQGQGSTAVGYNATATAESALALGRESRSTVVGGVALGAGSVADRALTPSNGSIVVGGGGALVPFNTTDRTLLGAVSVGSGTTYRQITNVADGTDDHDAVTVRQLTGAMTSLTITGTRYFHANSTQEDSLAAGEQSVAIGPNTVVNGEDGIGIGNGAIVEQNAPGGIAMGEGSRVQLADAVALGTKANAAAEQSVALGAGSSATAAGGVALGAGSVAATLAGVAGYIPATQGAAAVNATQSTLAAVSVGDATTGNFRQITGVAAGTVDSDAVNVSQLKSVAASVSDLDAGTVKYDRNPDGTINYESVTLNPGGAPTTIGNVAAGELSATSTEAVNGSQLNETNQNVAQMGDTITNIAGDTSQANTDANGMGIRYVRTNEAGLTQSDASAQGQGSTAVGYNATATAESALALGREANASHAGSVALGANAVADGATLGTAAYNPGTATIAGTTPVGEVSVGSANAERRLTNVAAGATDTDAVNVSQLKAVSASVSDLDAGAVKYDRNADGTINYGSVTLNPSGTGGSQIHNVAAGTAGTDAVNVDQLNQSIETNKTRYYSINDNGQRQANANNDGASGAGALAAGIGAVATGERALSVGNGNSATGARSAAIGSGNSVSGNGSYAYGSDNTIASADVFVIGSGVTVGAGLDGAVILGRGSMAVAATPTQRGIINGVEYLYAGGNPAAGDVVSVGSADAPRQIQHVAAGRVAADSLDAINGSQLYATNQAVDSLGQVVQNINTGGGIKYFHANGGAGGALPDSQASGAGSVAVGPAAVAAGAGSIAMGNEAAAGAAGTVAIGAGAQANRQGDVALGDGAIADRGAESYTGKYSNAQNDTAGTVSVGAPGAERTVSNVADGRNATDAVNLRQLDGAVKAANDYTDQRIGDVNQSVVEIGDTVNELDGRVAQVEGDVTKLKNGSDGMFQVSQDAGNVAPRAEGQNSVAGGAGAVASGSNGTAIGNSATASGSNSTAMGSGAKASGENATAMGNGSKAEANNSVALGAGSVADRNDTVSVGAAGAERQIVNVAPGTAGTDAVNVNQLRDVEGNLSNQIASVKGDLRRQDNRLSAGVASAMAMSALPQAYLPGKSMFSMGGGTWRGESGFAMGLSTVSDNGRWVVKGLASSSSRGDYGASVGVGYQW